MLKLKNFKKQLLNLIDKLNRVGTCELTTFRFEIESEAYNYLTVCGHMLHLDTPLHYVRSKELLLAIFLQKSNPKKFILQMKDEQGYQVFTGLKKI